LADVLSIDRDGASEADRLAEYPHPRETLWLVGHKTQERALLEAFREGRLHHAWLLAGPEGIGKAVLAYRFARFLLAHPDAASPAVQGAVDLMVPAEHPVAGQVARLSHPDLAVIRRGLAKDGKSLRTEIAVDDVRDGLAVFRVTSGTGGWRVVIVDAADDLNRSSANALLKMLEEPPARAVFLLIAQRPGALLPTIRSRCRMLRFEALDEALVREGLVRIGGAEPAAAEVAARSAHGSLRQGLKDLDPAVLAVRADLERIVAGLSRPDGRAAMALADKTQGKARIETFEAVVAAIEDHLRRRVRAGAEAGGEGRLLAAQAELWEKLRRSARDVETYNLDRRPFILSVLSALAEIERRSGA
jgi:DNA polymerase-3 subunit delta'